MRKCEVLAGKSKNRIFENSENLPCLVVYVQLEPVVNQILL